jgi:hypothetical protein
MVSIHNEEENAFILDTLQKRWKGPDDLLLGMFYDTDGKWRLPCEAWLVSVMLVRHKMFDSLIL